MHKTLSDVLRSLLPLSKKYKQYLAALHGILTEGQIEDLTYLLKTKKIGIFEKPQTAGPKGFTMKPIYEFHSLCDIPEVNTITKDFNRIVERKISQKNYEQFATHAKSYIYAHIAPNIIGLEGAKLATLLQLFSKERFHILLLGDPGTGKTDIIRSSSNLSPISSFGLGSGTSGAGLSVALEGKELKKGLLAQAHEGVCCIDELNLMKKEDRAALYSAMEKGFISYSKAGKNETVPAQTRVCATANPSGDRFIGKALSLLRHQLPFDSALLTRFHLVFVIRQPSEKELLEISKKIVQHKDKPLNEKEIQFIRNYVAYALSLDVIFPQEFEQNITQFIKEAKEQEDSYIIEVGPRMVHGLMRIAQAHARLHLRTKVNQADVDIACKILEESFVVPGIFGPEKR
jgi:replicative DNA helicase Mcm